MGFSSKVFHITKRSDRLRPLHLQAAAKKKVRSIKEELNEAGQIMTVHSLTIASDASSQSAICGNLKIVGCGDFHRNALRNLGSAASTDVEVLLLGPSGVGKELY